MDFLICDLEDRAIMSLGPLFCSLARARTMVYIGLFAGKLPVASPLLRSLLPLPFSVLPDLPQWLLQPAHHPSLLLYPSVRFCMHQNLDPSFPALQTLKCCSGLCLGRALCGRCSQADPHGLQSPFYCKFPLPRDVRVRSDLPRWGRQGGERQ